MVLILQNTELILHRNKEYKVVGSFDSIGCHLHQVPHILCMLYYVKCHSD